MNSKTHMDVVRIPASQQPLQIVAKREFSFFSPLRYPGGKAKLAGFFIDILESNQDIDRYVEPYAGGAGAGLALLLTGNIKYLHINDLDPAVYSFWSLLVNTPEKLITFIETVPLSIDEWRYQKEIYRSAVRPSDELGLAFFYLNRTNRSGILNAGVIGGNDQTGTYKIDARFNRQTLVRRVDTLEPHLPKITVTNEDGRDVIRKYGDDVQTLLYIDPPYVQAGTRLYLNAFDDLNHTNLADTIHSYPRGNWILTYDDDPLVHDLYDGDFRILLSINYSAHRKTRAQEILIASPSLSSTVTKLSNRNASETSFTS